MQKIPLIDVREHGLHKLVDSKIEQVKSLIDASRSIRGFISRTLSHIVLPSTDRLSREWLVKNRNPYLEEIDYTAHKLNTTGVYTLNICYEWGCTASVYTKPNGPTLARVLDWPFPKMGENIIIAHQSGPAGSFFNVTWPGLSAVFQGMAPGRFAASINQAPIKRHRLTSFGDRLVNSKRIFKSNELPPAHLLRKVFEKAKTYQEAKEWLALTPIAAPVIYTFSGVRDGEGCVIERTENYYDMRTLENGRVCAANQFDTSLNGIGHGWRPRPVKSADRARLAREIDCASINDNFDWFKWPIANANSRLVMLANAADSTLSAMGTHGATRVTETFDLKRARGMQAMPSPSA